MRVVLTPTMKAGSGRVYEPIGIDGEITTKNSNIAHFRPRPFDPS